MKHTETKQAIMPEQHIAPTIDSLWPGAQAYVVPWALIVDLDGCCWLRGDFSIHETLGGTWRMEITRTPAGFECKLPEDELYQKLWVDSATIRDYKLRPVVKLRSGT